MAERVPQPRGRLSAGQDLSALTWLRVGGPAEWFFQPADAEDLAAFLAALDPSVPVFAMGVGSNLIVRDGGVPGVVIRLGRAFADLAIDGTRIHVGAAMLDAQLAKRAADAGLDLTFLRTIPGSIGGAVRMNAGCYGTYVADHLISVDVVLRDGTQTRLDASALQLAYRSSALPEGAVIIAAQFEAPKAAPQSLHDRMAEQLARRDATQPTKDRTAGSTFRNPAGYSSTGEASDSQELKAWSLIDSAGMRGARLGGAVMNEKHPNFLTNAGGARAAELEALGEKVREKVFQTHQIELCWEIMRVGVPE